MVDKVKTYVCGFAENDFSEIFKYLDQQVEQLGNIEIKSVTDQYMIVKGEKHGCVGGLEVVKRTVVYRTLDTKVWN